MTNLQPKAGVLLEFNRAGNEKKNLGRDKLQNCSNQDKALYILTVC